MDKILHHQGWWLSHDSEGFNHPRWLFGISSINRRIQFSSGLFSGFLFLVAGTNVQEAMDIYGATRIGHGYRSVETQVLIPVGKR